MTREEYKEAKMNAINKYIIEMEKGMKNAKSKRQKENYSRCYYRALSLERKYMNDFWNTITGLWTQDNQWLKFYQDAPSNTELSPL